MKTLQFLINIILNCIRKKKSHQNTKQPSHWEPRLRVLTKYHPSCVCTIASGLLESSFKIDCTEADFPRLMGTRDRAHTSYASKPTIDLKCISLNEWHVATPGRKPWYKELNWMGSETVPESPFKLEKHPTEFPAKCSICCHIYRVARTPSELTAHYLPSCKVQTVQTASHIHPSCTGKSCLGCPSVLAVLDAADPNKILLVWNGPQTSWSYLSMFSSWHTSNSFLYCSFSIIQQLRVRG